MKLLRLRAEGFGPLRGEYFFAPDRLNLIVDENERGKSSLLAAVAAGLYGIMDDRRSHRVMTPVERWRPWGGGPYRIELGIECIRGRFTIVRDFDRGTVEVWNDRGQEITHEFREGKDSYPVGWWLLGLDAEEFEKCVFLRQGDLDHVVPYDEKARRNSTLHARLESAADTRGGDSSATAATRALADASAAYPCPEIEATIKVENAILRLESKRNELAIQVSTLEYDLERMAPELEVLASLTEDEARLRAALDGFEAERRAGRAREAAEVLAEDARRRDELSELRDEVARLERFTAVPADAEARLRAAHARFDEARHRMARLTIKLGEADEERARLQGEIDALGAYTACTEDDAVLLATHGAQIRNAQLELERLRSELERREADLSGKGHESDRFELLAASFATLSAEDVDLLRSQSSLELKLKGEEASIAKARTESADAIRRIEGARRRRSVPGWIAIAVGLVAGVGGIVAAPTGALGIWVALSGGVALLAIAAGGALVELLGVGLLVAAGRWHRHEREDAQDRLGEAEEARARLEQRRKANETRLVRLATELGHPSGPALHYEWVDYQRLLEERGPAQALRSRLAEGERRREALAHEAGNVLQRAGGGPAEPGPLDLAAAGIRRLVAARQRLAEFERNWASFGDDERAARAALDDAEADVTAVLESAGIVPERGHPREQDLAELSERVRGRSRHELLVRDLVPRAEKSLLEEHALEDLRGRTGLGAIDPAGTQGPPRADSEIEADVARDRASLDDVAKRRADLRLHFEQRSRDCKSRLADLRFDSVRMEAALERAHRFKRSIELARQTIQDVALDTHRRWADFLNQRVVEIVTRVGGAIEQVRFGEDLDFAVKPAGGPQLSRGKAMLQLSSGARDQLHLAVRLAIGEYLSRGREALPLLIDDCFATSDDERARAGMRLLIEHFAREHQVILVTCQRKRYQTLAALDPEVYGNRVHWLDARTVEVG